jgi:hypothetical protein
MFSDEQVLIPLSDDTEAVSGKKKFKGDCLEIFF